MFKKLLYAVTFTLVIGFLVTSAVAAGTNPKVLMETSQGKITIELYPQKSPVTVKNFLSYVQDDFYTGTSFHRVKPGFMIQGGGFTAELLQKPTRIPIPNEAANGLKNDRGTIAMARTSDPDSATAQFFINLVNNDGLNRPQPDGYGYAVFGRVIEGLDVVDRIAEVRTGTRKGMRDVPLDPVEIKSVKILK
ncbi:MAG: peptidylprolyl isomerase [Geobacteraceae bacterium]